MRYPIAIERGTETAAYGVVVPDLPGCFSAGDTLDEAIPVPTGMDALVADHAYAGWILAAVMVDPALLDEDGADQYHPITLSRRVLLRLDARAAGASRSGYIAHLMLGDREA